MAKSAYYTSTHWQELRAKALRRDNYGCQSCGARCTGKKRGGQTPYVDHIKPRPYVDTPTHYDTLANLQTLCGPCHSKKTRWVDQAEKPQVGVDGLPSDGSWG